MGGARAVLVTGMSGTGKTTALTELARRGHTTVDTDEPGWIVVVDGEPLWDVGAMRGLLDAHTEGSLFVGGCVANQGRFHDRFDAVVLLSAPVEVLLARVVDRVNPYGATEADRTTITADVATFEPVLRRGATHEVDTTVAVSEVADALERIALRPGV